MILQTLREQVLEANLEVVRRGLVLYTFGNASGIDRDQGIVAIKPSGVPYETMRASDIVLVDLEGRPVQGGLRPSSDLPLPCRRCCRCPSARIGRARPETSGTKQTPSA